MALSLRQVAKEVGIVPTAFYRHFDSIESLGLALVDESFVSLRAMLRDIRARRPAVTVSGHRRPLGRDAAATHVHQQRSHFLFIARERAAGPPAVREAIRHEIELCERELATDLARLPGTERLVRRGPAGSLSNLIVTRDGRPTAEQISRRGRPRPDAEKQIVETARTQLRMVLVGALNWESRQALMPGHGLAALGYDTGAANSFQRAIQAFASQRPGVLAVRQEPAAPGQSTRSSSNRTIATVDWRTAGVSRCRTSGGAARTTCLDLVSECGDQICPCSANQRARGRVAPRVCE